MITWDFIQRILMGIWKEFFFSECSQNNCWKLKGLLLADKFREAGDSFLVLKIFSVLAVVGVNSWPFWKCWECLVSDFSKTKTFLRFWRGFGIFITCSNACWQTQQLSCWLVMHLPCRQGSASLGSAWSWACSAGIQCRSEGHTEDVFFSLTVKIAVLHTQQWD